MKKKIKENNNTRKETGEKIKTPKWFYLILIIIPFLFFILLEIGLRIFNYGNDYTLFQNLSEEFSEYYFINPDIGKKYFNTKVVPAVIPDAFKINKSKNSYRIFVLGESSTAGWPYVSNASFPRQLKRRLQLLYPNKEIEVINMGMSAISSFTIRDFVPQIIEQKPDLVLIYTGHNEYYGSLGVGSAESLGKNRFFVNLFLSLQDYKTIDLIRNVIKWTLSIGGSSSASDKEGQETLMGRMIGESLIPLDSDTFNEGIKQFEGNLTDIISMLKKNNINIILSTVASNIKDHKPFNSIESNNLPSAESIYNQAKINYQNGNIEKAKELFYYAKDLDALRFRAPEKINSVIKEIGNNFNLLLVDFDSLFSSKSENGLIGNNIMVDHLHPNIEGYSLIAKGFYEVIEGNKLIPDVEPIKYSINQQDSILNSNFPFTRLDSLLAEMKLIQLLGSYPFVPKGSPNLLMRQHKIKDFIDTISVLVINGDMFWDEAHSKVADWYYNQNDFENFFKEMRAIIADRPFNQRAYSYAIDNLNVAGRFDLSIILLLEMDKYFSGAYSNKWIGQIYLNNGNYKKALPYLEKSVTFSSNDSQVWYNLSGAYFYNNEFQKAIDAIKTSISIDPSNQMAKSYYQQLQDYIQSNN